MGSDRCLPVPTGNNKYVLICLSGTWSWPTSRHIFLITREPVPLWAQGLETPNGDGSSFSHVTTFPPPPCRCRDSKFMDSKRVSSEEIQATISAPSINGNGRHHWSQSISVCCQQIERVRCRTTLVAAELDLLMSPRRQSVSAQQTRPLEPPAIIETSQWRFNYQCRHVAQDSIENSSIIHWSNLGIWEYRQAWESDSLQLVKWNCHLCDCTIVRLCSYIHFTLHPLCALFKHLCDIQLLSNSLASDIYGLLFGDHFVLSNWILFQSCFHPLTLHTSVFVARKQHFSLLLKIYYLYPCRISRSTSNSCILSAFSLSMVYSHSDGQQSH